MSLPYSSKKRSGRSSGGGGAGEMMVPEPSGGADYQVEDSVMDDQQQQQQQQRNNKQRPALSPNSIEESMILSDEDEEHQQAFEDKVEGQNNVYVEDEEDDNYVESDVVQQIPGDSKPPASKKIWTGRTKKNHANLVNAASSALMVEDKPWRKATSKGRTSADAPPPKSPSRIGALVSKPGVSTLPSPANFNSNATSPVDATRRPLLKYIRGFGAGNASPQSPARRGQKGAPDEVAAGHPGVWNDEIDDDHSSISSEMISYSSIESMDDSDDEVSLPLDDYVRNPEVDPDFWEQLPYVPVNFVLDQNNDSNNNDVPIIIGSPSTSVAGTLPYLDIDLKTLTLSDPSRINDFFFVLDHRFYLRALFQLLAERDEVGVEDSIHDDKNIIKKGPLRKKYLGLVKFKFLELRKGNLVYFGDGDGEGRKTIHLRAATASCNSVDSPSSTETDADPNSASTSPSAAHTPGVSTISGTGMHAAASLSAGLTSAVNATTSAASTIAGGTSVTQGYEFHLWVEGKRYAWLANSKSEQQSWVRAIRQAMIGDKVNDDDWGMTLNATNAHNNADDPGSSHDAAQSSYQTLQSKLKNAATTEVYQNSFAALFQRPASPAAPPALQIPLKWVRGQMPKEKVDLRKDGNSQQRRVKTSIAEFWRNMGKFDFAINGHVIGRESPNAAERTIGALVRCILDYDRSFSEVCTSDPPSMPALPETPGQSVYENTSNQSNQSNQNTQNKRSETDRISELDAVSYARSILLLIIKSKTSGIIEFAVDNLCNNEDLVIVDRVDPSSSMSTSPETLHIDVSFAGDDVVDHFEESYLSNEVSGWVMVRRSKYNSWKTRFCVFSEGIFSYYENAKPRPHGLRGQLLLTGAGLNEVTEEKDRAREDSGLYILRLTTKGQERERQFGFKIKEEFLEWKEAIQLVVDTCDSSTLDEENAMETSGANVTAKGREPKKSIRIIEEGSKLISYATDGGMKAIKGATDGGMKVVKGGTKAIKDATGGSVKAIRGATNLMFRSIRSGKGLKRDNSSQRPLRKSPSLQFLMENTRTEKTGRREPTVQCIIQTTSEFRILSVNPTAVATDTLVTVRVKFLQAYLLSGGSSGRLARGDAMIEMDFVDEMREVPQLC